MMGEARTEVTSGGLLVMSVDVMLLLLSFLQPQPSSSHLSNFTHSFTHAAATTAFVEATAGMMFLTTPMVSM